MRRFLLSQYNNISVGFLTFVATSHPPTRLAPPHFPSTTYHPSFSESCYVKFHMKYSISSYRTSNLMCMSILPGPKEQSPDEFQWFLHPIISDLLRLWKDRIRIPTESRLEGIMAVVCDKPAAHKMGGFASHSHNHFCTLCWIPAEDKTKPVSFQDGGESPQLYMLH